MWGRPKEDQKVSHTKYFVFVLYYKKKNTFNPYAFSLFPGALLKKYLITFTLKTEFVIILTMLPVMLGSLYIL